MHLTRAQTKRLVPIVRKGTKYVVRARSHTSFSIPVLIAVRDMLHIARTAKEVNALIKDKKLKINGKVVRDSRESIKLLSIFEADKKYILDLLESGRFSLKETKHNSRIAKVVGKTTLAGNVSQINLHDGTNFVGKEKVQVGDSIELDMNSKVISIIKMEKGKSVLVKGGKKVGMRGVIAAVDGDMVNVKFDGKETSLPKSEVITL